MCLGFCVQDTSQQVLLHLQVCLTCFEIGKLHLAERVLHGLINIQ